MNSTNSVSKGCFVFKNGATRADTKAKKAPKRKRPLDPEITVTNLLGREINQQPFYTAYHKMWSHIRQHIEDLSALSHTRTLGELVEYVVNECSGSGNLETYDMKEILPTAALLTGINQPDHLAQFKTLSQRIQEKISASVCVLQSRDCPTVKATVEAMVYQYLEDGREEEDRDHRRLRKSQCTMKHLRNWYRNNFIPLCGSKRGEYSTIISSDDDREGEEENALEKDSDNASMASSQMTYDSQAEKGRASHALLVILPDFECFHPSILEDFILILSSYCRFLPFVLILGIATAVSAVHSTLSYHVTSKIKLKVFQTQAAPLGLNEILDKIILSPKYAFHLSGKAFKFLTHIFLYYDFSIQGFIQGFKYCLMEHYFQGGNAYALCSSYQDSLTRLKSLTHEDMEAIRRCLSFRPYVEGINDCKRVIAILTDDEYLRKKLPQLLSQCHIYFLVRRTFLEFLTELVGDLPKCPLGKLRRELYATSLSKDLTSQPEFKECWQLLSFLSKDEFVLKVQRAITVTEHFFKIEVLPLELGPNCDELVMTTLGKLKALIEKVHKAGVEVISSTEDSAQQAHFPRSPEVHLKSLTSRKDFKERLLQMAQQQPKKSKSEFSKTVQDTLNYIEGEIVQRHLAPLERAPPLHELFVFSDIDTVRRNIIGAPRAALHMALNNPFYYLQCKCCELKDDIQLLPTLPDLSVAYKLHLEGGRMINLFDWLQAFRSVVDEVQMDEDENEQIDPQIQARFTRAVAELQFLGYIKMSKRKTDHATRLTW